MKNLIAVLVFFGGWAIISCIKESKVTDMIGKVLIMAFPVLMILSAICWLIMALYK